MSDYQKNELADASRRHEIIKKAASYLRTMGNERLIKERVIIPLFEAQGWPCENRCHDNEYLHSLDVLLVCQNDSTLLRGIQLKKKNITSPSYVATHIKARAITAFNFKYSHDGQDLTFAKFTWITTGEIRQRGRDGIEDLLRSDMSTRGRVQVWDAIDLVKYIIECNCHHLLEPLESWALEEAAHRHLSRGEGHFSRYYERKNLLWNLSHRSGSIEQAYAASVRSLDSMAKMHDELERRVNSSPRVTPHTRIRFGRVTELYFSSWQTLLKQPPKRLHSLDETPKQLMQALVSTKVSSLLSSQHGPTKAALLADCESCWLQLQLLADRYQVQRPSLTTIQLMRLLLRTSVSPEEPILSARLLRLKQALGHEHGESIDSHCSLCTATAVSCLELAGLHDVAVPASTWLATLEKERFAHLEGCYYGAAPDEHALHYTATVLIAFLDARLPHETVLETFFRDPTLDEHGFYSEWMRYRNVDRHEVCRYIFGAFIHLLLAGHELGEDRKRFLASSVLNLLRYLERDARDQTRMGTMYSTRMNLCSFVLGCLLGLKECVEPARQIVVILRARALEVAADSLDDSETWDSGFERTCILVESLLQAWEVYLLFSEKGDPNAVLLAEVLAPLTAASQPPPPSGTPRKPRARPSPRGRGGRRTRSRR